ncbi:hypothetical protein RUM44_005494 [Polyplax serrata]|uniref:28S ribosomal protein S36, mitochondrial n=1 Tax=Polyplax serrata TaxID=468196 RepID=A0ABR1ADI8_POLSC
MMTGILLNSWKSVKQHIPLIKFRKGGSFTENTSAAVSAVAGGSKSPDITSGNVQQPPVIEDWQIPPHYRRATLDDKEIDAINSGGAY